ncbi:hypothetical protein IC607_11285 [Cellulomonas sp. JH27-2]|uniref:hypothetical protein n=1 Tax=Cellulomonas sp. JH27-2 TaxID=2774139 RepID=UPI00177CBF7D|nr:hypothetical protein [Cellulomonas sp. JH27-2]MBD8059549.1 hypothetical protein [Cellulomonas sp. JH27-2]
MTSPRRASRRAVRPAGTVGTDDAILRSTHAAAPTPEEPTVRRGQVEDAHEPALPIRSADDSDLGWGESTDGNDERLRRDKPPHW